MEIWKDVLGYEGYYQVSSHGRVRSVDRTITTKGNGSRIYFGKIISPKIKKGGHYEVSLSRYGRGESLTVHRLVYLSFKGTPPEGHIVHHIDENKLNNRISNLTTMENGAHVSFHVSSEKCLIRGVYGPTSVLTKEEVLEIVDFLDNSSLSVKEIASRFRISPSTVNNINVGSVWNWLTGRNSTPKHQQLNGIRKLLDEEVVSIREEIALGKNKNEIAVKYGVTATHVRRIGKGYRKQAAGSVASVESCRLHCGDYTGDETVILAELRSS